MTKYLNLRMVRKERGMTALDMAKALDIAESTYYMKESGNRPFLDREIRLILKKLNCTFEEVFSQKN